MFSMTACSLGQSIEVLDQDKIVLLQTEDMVSGEDIAVVETSEGVFKMRFFPSEAPKTVENFIELAESGYFDGQMISRIEKIDDHRVRALDWDNLELSTEKTVTEDVTSIGIRAHDFEPVKDPEGINHIPVGHAKISEMPFEWYITLQNGLWWKIGKTIHTHSADGLIPEYVRVAPQAILLLKG